MAAEYRRGDDGQSLVVQSDDAGRLLVSLGLSDGAEDGLLRLAARREPAVGTPAPWAGSMRIEGMRLVQAPVLARILAASSLTTLQQSLATQGLTFDVVEAAFRLGDETLTIEDGRAVGGALGLTLNGTVDRVNDRVDLAGTLVPIFGVNQAIGSIPLIGDVLTGGDDQGVFALTYAVGGPLDAPAVSINPLSALAPGFLRRLFFEAPTGDAPVSIIRRREDR